MGETRGGATGWRVVGGVVSAWFGGKLGAGAELVGQVVAGVGEGGGVPEMELRGGGVRVRAGAPERGGWEVAARVSEIAAELGMVADPEGLQELRVLVGATDESGVREFWRTVLGYDAGVAGGLRDPWRREVGFRVGALKDERPLRNRVHVDVVRDEEVVRRVRRELGQEGYGVYGLTLADGEGNEVDLVPGGGIEAGGGIGADEGRGNGAEDWRLVFGGMVFWRAGSARRAGEFAVAVAGIADEVGWPLLVDLRGERVVVDTGKDVWEDEGAGQVPFVEMAGRVQAAARGMGLVAEPEQARFVQLAIDAVDVAGVRGFWARLLGYALDTREFVTDIYDPRRLGSVIIFQELDAGEVERRRQRNRIWFELMVPADQLEQRVGTALAAGGRIVGDRTQVRCLMADPEGNEVEISAQ